MKPRPHGHFNLRQRVAATFAVGALAVSVILALTTYLVAADYLWQQREKSVVLQTGLHLRTVNDALATGRPSIDQLLRRFDVTGGQNSEPLLLHGDRWFDQYYGPGHSTLPTGFVEAAERGEPVWQRFADQRGGDVAVAVAMPTTSGSYVEVFPLTELDQTLTALALIFAGTSTMTALLGLLLGQWASRRSLRPLSEITTAAGAIASGDLKVRLARQRDPDLQALGEAFNRTVGRLQARVARDVRFAANVSHELRSPLTTIVNAVEVLRTRAASLDAPGHEALELLADEAHRIATTVEDLLEISRLDDDQTVTHRDSVRLGELVGSVADRIAARPVTTVEGPADPVVELDRRRIEHVVENLVRNAETHGRGVAHVTVRAGGETVTITVDDRGDGIPLAERQRIFERFARGSRSNRVTGSGLGLSIVEQQVKLHGGQVWVEDGPGGVGARFVVELPWVGP